MEWFDEIIDRLKMLADEEEIISSVEDLDIFEGSWIGEHLDEKFVRQRMLFLENLKTIAAVIYGEWILEKIQSRKIGNTMGVLNKRHVTRREMDDVFV